MTRPLPFTESHVRRAIAAVLKAGLQIGAVSIAPDGTVTIHHGIAPPFVPAQSNAQSKWLDVEA